MALEHLGHLLHLVPEPLHWLDLVRLQAAVDEAQHVVANLGPVEQGDIAMDRAQGFQAPHPGVDGGRGKVQLTGEIGARDQ